MYLDDIIFWVQYNTVVGIFILASLVFLSFYLKEVFTNYMDQTFASLLNLLNFIGYRRILTSLSMFCPPGSLICYQLCGFGVVC